jgi:hypothetical protein
MLSGSALGARERESVLFIGTQFSNLYTVVDTRSVLTGGGRAGWLTAELIAAERTGAAPRHWSSHVSMHTERTSNCFYLLLIYT